MLYLDLTPDCAAQGALYASGLPAGAQRPLQPVVAVPARNEAERLPHLFAALAAQTWVRQGARLHLVVVINNSDDGSLEVAHALAQRHPEIDLLATVVNYPPAMAHVGSARRLSVDLALQLMPDTQRGVVLMTDADSRPDPGWVAGALAAIEAGAHVVGGEIIGDPPEEERLGADFLRRAALRKRYDHLANYLAHLVDPDPEDPWPRHRDHTGASLAVRADWLVRVGGLPPLPSREDLALVAALQRHGAVLRHDPAVRVTTSARLDGRAAGGMAACLRRWIAAGQNGEPLLVESPDVLLDRLKRRALIRALPTLARRQRRAICARAGCDHAAVEHLIASGANGRALAARLAPHPADPLETDEANGAIARLEAMIAFHEGAEFECAL